MDRIIDIDQDSPRLARVILKAMRRKIKCGFDRN